MSLPAPIECLTLPECCQVPTSPFYGQGITFLNAQTGFLLTCPPGFSCDAGAYPHPIIVDKGIILFTPPPGQSPLRATCCDGVILARYLPAGFSLAEFSAAAQSLVNEMATHLAGCMATQYNAAHSTKKTCSITTAATLPEGNVGVPYSATLSQTGLDAPVTWSLLAGALPPGLALSSGGVISGTPTGSSASYGFTVRARHTTTSCVKTFTITINGCGAETDWCGDPGTCRLRVKDFNLLDWDYVWDGQLSETEPAVPPSLPCISYNDGFEAGLGYSMTGGYWQLTIICPDLISYYQAIGPAGPSTTSPIGTYTALVNDPPCTGPATFDIEAYVP